MAHTPTVTNDLAAGLHNMADRINATPSITHGRRYPTIPAYIFLVADTLEDVRAAAIAAGERVYRDGDKTYVDITTDMVMLRFAYVPDPAVTVLQRPLDVTDELAGRDA
ncbi:hypothetical protein [Microbacterium sp. 1P06AB]|uniref:hypothetical protein n=1 Tax=Microbacterium sp. 1P06AB TaxID=3132289 RepID=UPI0039A65D4B